MRLLLVWWEGRLGLGVGWRKGDQVFVILICFLNVDGGSYNVVCIKGAKISERAFPLWHVEYGMFFLCG